MCTWLKQHEHDRLVRIANAQEKSVSALVRELLTVKMPSSSR